VEESPGGGIPDGGRAPWTLGSCKSDISLGPFFLGIVGLRSVYGTSKAGATSPHQGPAILVFMTRFEKIGLTSSVLEDTLAVTISTAWITFASCANATATNSMPRWRASRLPFDGAGDPVG
jgi:hypothetical protein